MCGFAKTVQELPKGTHTMAASQSALLDLLDALNASDGLDMVRTC